MSHSYRHTPCCALGGGFNRGEQWWKRHAHRALRRRVHVALRQGRETLPALREVSSVWTWPKDGKFWFGGWTMATAEDMRRLRGK